jgi:hypothetical protein
MTTEIVVFIKQTSLFGKHFDFGKEKPGSPEGAGLSNFFYFT